MLNLKHAVKFFLLLTGLFFTQQTLAVDKTFFELVTEGDGTSRLNGAHFITYIESNSSTWAPYIGGGLVYVELPDADDNFPAVHLLTGFDHMFNKAIGLNFEFGLDLGEYFLSNGDEKGLPSAVEESNDVDYSMAAGVVVKFDKSAYLKIYGRYHQFDGTYLPSTSVNFAGLRFGLRF